MNIYVSEPASLYGCHPDYYKLVIVNFFFFLVECGNSGNIGSENSNTEGSCQI